MSLQPPSTDQRSQRTASNETQSDLEEQVSSLSLQQQSSQGTDRSGSDRHLLRDLERNDPPEQTQFRVYRRRFFGLAALTMLNLLNAWAGGAFTALTTQYATYFKVPVANLNLLSSVSYAAFIVPCPLAIWIIGRYGVKASLNVCAVMLLIGTWISYAGTRSKSYGTLLAGNIITGAAQPFALTAPTKFSKTWFSPNARTLATAAPSLAYAMGAGFATLIGPVIYDNIGILGLTLTVASIATAGAIPMPFIPNKPPTPPSIVGTEEQMPLLQALKLLSRTPPFYLQCINFSVLAGCFLNTTGLIVNIMRPYGFDTSQVSIAGALMIFVGVGASLIVSPLVDRFGGHLKVVKVIIWCLAGSYTALIFIGQTRSAAAVYIIFSLLGVFSFSVEPCVLEFQAAWTHPVPPEISSTFCWAGAQFCACIFTVIISYGINRKQTSSEDATMPITGGLVFQAVMVWAVLPLGMLTGVWKFKRSKQSQIYEK